MNDKRFIATNATPLDPQHASHDRFDMDQRRNVQVGSASKPTSASTDIAATKPMNSEPATRFQDDSDASPVASTPVSPSLPIQNPALQSTTADKEVTRSRSSSSSGHKSSFLNSKSRSRRASTSVTTLASPQIQPVQHSKPRNRYASMLSLFTLKDPSIAALDDMASEQRKQANSKDLQTPAMGLPHVSSQKLPASVPAVNSKWDGLPRQSRPDSKDSNERRDSGWSSRLLSLRAVSSQISPRRMIDETSPGSPFPSSNVLPDDNQRKEFPFFSPRSPLARSNSTALKSLPEVEAEADDNVEVEPGLPGIPTVSSLAEDIVMDSPGRAVSPAHSDHSLEDTVRETPSKQGRQASAKPTSNQPTQRSQSVSYEPSRTENNPVDDLWIKRATSRAKVEAFLQSQDDREWVSGLDEVTVSSSGLNTRTTPKRASIGPFGRPVSLTAPSSPTQRPLSQGQRIHKSGSGSEPQTPRSGNQEQFQPTGRPHAFANTEPARAIPGSHKRSVSLVPGPSQTSSSPSEWHMQSRASLPTPPSTSQPHRRSQSVHTRNFSKPFNIMPSENTPPDSTAPVVESPSQTQPIIGHATERQRHRHSHHASRSSQIAERSSQHARPNLQRANVSTNAPIRDDEAASQSVTELSKNFALSTAFWDLTGSQNSPRLKSDQEDAAAQVKSRLDGPFDPMIPF